MANTESDATYCSEAEKENLSQRRRSKRLSQKLDANFRSNGYRTCQRFNEIHQLLKSDTFGSGWTRHDWLALQFEVDLLKNSLQGIGKSRIKFVEKTIDKHLQASSVTLGSNVPLELCQIADTPYELVKSPNILAGMTAEVFTELPPYQPVNPPNIMQTNNLLTQANPLDLTKKDFEVADNLIEANPNKNGTKQTGTATPVDSMIDLTDDVDIDDNQENTTPAGEVELNPVFSKKVLHTSKWVKYLPTQQKTAFFNENQKKAQSPMKNKPKSFKHSLIKLYKESSNSNAPMKVRKSTSTRSLTKVKDGHKHKIPSSIPQQPKPTSMQDKTRNIERATSFILDFDQANISPRNVESEYIAIPSPDFLIDFLRANDDNESLPLSLKENCKKILGTDCLHDLLGCEKIAYSLTERHVERLASALNLKHDSLKRTIEQILADNSCTLFDDDQQSGSSRVECSQSPTQRLFPSQRSQISK